MNKAREKTAVQYVLVRDLAQYLHREKCNLRDRIREAGIEIFMIRGPKSGQPSLAVTTKDAKKIIADEPPIAEVISPQELMRKK